MTWEIDCRFSLITMAFIHSYFVDIFVHGKLLRSSTSRTHVIIYDVKKSEQNTRESMPNCYSTYVYFDSFYLTSIVHVHLLKSNTC